MKNIIAPILTEKAAMGMDRGLYVLEVTPEATKNSVASELFTQFGLQTESVRIVNLPSKRVKFKRIPGVQPARCKAYVQLKAGQKLPGFELPKEKETTPAKKEKA